MKKTTAILLLVIFQILQHSIFECFRLTRNSACCGCVWNRIPTGNSEPALTPYPSAEEEEKTTENIYKLATV